MSTKIIQENRKINFEYTILDRLEVGIELISYEVKQIANKKCNIVDSFAKIINDEVWLFNMHIPKFEQAVFYVSIEEKRTRKLLLHKKQIKKWKEEIKLNNYTLVPSKIYFNTNGKCKLELCLCKGKKVFDKKEALKERDIKRYEDRHCT